MPGDYNFYEFHSAIQDAMGWGDCHLHQFHMKNPKTGQKEYIGTPSEDSFGFEPIHVVPEEEAKIADYFLAEKDKAMYEYDFGDCWKHDIVLEKIMSPVAGVEYPRCVAGKRACPPEDCGSTPGYEELLEIIADPEHKEHKERMEWLQMLGYDVYDPEEFDPKEVVFEDPKERKEFRAMFGC